MSNPFDGPLGGLTAAIMGRMNAAAEREAADLAAVEAGERALVIGFGAGVGVALLARRGAQVVGIDPSAAMLRAATRRNREAIAAGQVVLLGRALQDFKPSEQRFGLAVAVHSLQFCRPLDLAAARLAMLLAPGARLVTITHDWALAGVAGSAEAFLAEARAAFADAGFVGIAATPALADKGRAVRFLAQRPD